MGTSTSAIFTVTTASATGTQPGPAGNLIASGITSTGVTLTWTPPTTGNLGFSYKVQQADLGTINWIDATSIITAMTATLSGLTPNHKYQYQIITFNNIGQSTSAILPVTTLGTLPGAPTGLAVVGQPGTNTISLQWTAPSVIGSPAFTFYTLQYKLSTDTSFGGSQQTSATSSTVSGLVSGLQYDFEVSAGNTVGSGPNSVVLSKVQTAAALTAPSAPTNLQAGTLTTTSAQIAWTASASGSDPKTYTLQYRPH